MRKTIISFLMLVCFLLNACSQNEETVEIDDKGFANMLLVQKIEGNIASDDMTKIVKDKEKITETLEMVEGLEVKEIEVNRMFEKLRAQNAYMFSFLENDVRDTEKIPYAFYILEDGTVLFTAENVGSPEYPRVSIAKQEDLLDEMREMLDVEF